NGAGSSADSRSGCGDIESGTPGAVRIVVDHPQPGPELEVEFVALAVLLHEPGRSLRPRHRVHDDRFVAHAAAVADPAQVERAGEGDALVAHARRCRPD